MFRLPLKNKVDIAILIIGIILINIFYVTYRSSGYVREMDTRIARIHEILFALETVLAHSIDLSTGQRGYALTGKEEYLEPFLKARQSIDTPLAKLEVLVADNPRQRVMINSLKSLIKRKIELGTEAIAVRKTKGIEEAIKLNSNAERESIMKSIRQLVKSMKDEELNLLDLTTKRKEEFLSKSNANFVLLSSLVISFLVIFYFLVRNGTIKLSKLNRKLESANQEMKASEEILRGNLMEINTLQEHLRESERHYRGIVENATDMIYELDERGRFFFANSVLQSTSGYTQQELQQMMYWDLIHPDHVKRVVNFYREQLREKKLTTYLEFPILNRSGVELWVGQNAKMFFKEDGWVWKVSIVARDITELKTVQEKLERSERLYRLLSNNTRDLITLYAADENATRLFVSPSSKDILGYEPEELVGKSPFELILEEDAIRMKEQTHPTTLSGRLANTEYRIRKKDGTIIWMESNSTPILDKEGRLEGFQTSARDITQRKQFEFELIKAKEKAEEATTAKSSFLSTMSHEIRTPMNAVIGLTNWLLQREPRKEQIESLKLLKFSGENLLAIINDILDFSKIEAGKLTLEYSDFDLHGLTTNIYNMLEHRANDKGIVLHIDYDKKIPAFVHGDKVRISQILTNLLGNAIKFTEKGRVDMSIHYSGKEGGKCKIDFTIRDTGVGIPADKISYIFEGFSQAHAAAKFGGTGLGLSISKRLLKLMGSDINVESKLGVGSAFSFSLMLSTVNLPDSASGAEVKNTGELSQLPINILLVDDNEINLIVASNFLQLWGANVDTAMDGKEAVEMVKSKTYHAILMDIQMPELNGYEASRIIRSMDDLYFKTIPIIALTASATIDVKETVIASGMNDYLTKPFQPEELHGMLVEHTQIDKKAPAPAPVAKLTSQDHLPVAETINSLFDPEKFKEQTAHQVKIQEVTANAFVKFTPSILNTIKEAVERSDAEGIYQSVHKLKASTSLLCIESLRNEIIYIEKEASLVGQPDYNYRIHLLLADMHKLIEEVKVFKDALKIHDPL